MHSQEFESKPAGKAILLSVKPRFAEQIALGVKTVELRRSWPSHPVDVIVIYSSTPIQRIVAVADVEEVVEKTPSALWNYSKVRGVGLTRIELFDYLDGKTKGFAASLSNIRTFAEPVLPTKLFAAFTAPQSFRYLTEKEIAKVIGFFHAKGGRRC